MNTVTLAQSSRDPFAPRQEQVPALQVIMGDPVVPPTQPSSSLAWMPWAAGAMCVIGLALLLAAARRSGFWRVRREKSAPASALAPVGVVSIASRVRSMFTRHAEPRSGPALFAAAAEALDVPRPRAKMMLELAEATGTEPLGLLLSDHAVSRGMVASAIAQRERRLYA